MRANDLTGQVFGKLTVIKRVDGGSSRWLCHCECGNEKVIYGTNLVNGKSKTCGCSKYVHGEAGSKLYNIHVQMLRIGACDEWKDYSTFKKWAVDNGYKEGVRITRLDVNEDYSPDNCEIREKA